MKKRVLITGGAGRIGSILNEHLKDKYDVVLLDIKSKKGVQKVNLGNPNIKKYFRKVDTVIHLAAFVSSKASWKDTLKYNIDMAQNVFESAKDAGVKKIIFASSNHAMGGYYSDRKFKGKIKEDMPVRPDSFYGVSKVFGEDLGRYYSDTFGINFIALRIGAVRPNDDISGYPMGKGLWLSWRDCAQIFELCVKKNFRFEIFNAESDNKENPYTLSKAKRLLGYKPKDNASRK